MFFNCFIIIFLVFSNQLSTLGFYVTFNVVKLILIAFFKFQHVTMMVFNVCVNDTVQLLYSSINFIVEDLLMMTFDWSCDPPHGYDCWLSVYYK